MKFSRLLLLIVSVASLNASCKKDDPPLPDNLVQFQASEQGLSDAESAATITLKLSRVTDKDITLSIGVTEAGVTYSTDYTTAPATASGKIALTVPAGSSEVSFTVTKTSGVLFDGDENITFQVQSAATPVIIGTTAQLKLSFAEILSLQADVNIDGGGATYPNKVFIDLSANRQTAVLRTNWDIGFYSGSDYRVTLNSSTAMMARVLDKNDLNKVTSADTVNFAAEMSLNAFSTAAYAYIDDPSGDITKTAIAEVSATDADNKVYIIFRGNGVAPAAGSPAPSLGWKKVRVLRTATGYKIQYADIDATTFTETEIAKDAAYNFKYIHFDNGAVDIEPAKDKWDIAWTYFTNGTNFGAGLIPYGFQDVILTNRNGIETVKVLTATTAYDAFTEADIASLTFSASQTGIGSDWRFTSQTGTPSIYTDRFYIIKDAAGNYYKMKFNAITTNGERGKPVFEYALVKKA